MSVDLLSLLDQVDDPPCVKTSGDELTQGVVITYVDDLLLSRMATSY